MVCTEKELGYAKNYREKNREKINARRKENYQKHIEEERAYSLPRAKEWYKKNKARKLKYDGIYKKRFEVVSRNLYLWMKYRCGKIGTTYQNRKILFSIEEFLAVANSSKTLRKIYNQWVDSGYQAKLRPTVDRINNGGEYSITNIQFLSMIDNINKYWNKDRKL